MLNVCISLCSLQIAFAQPQIPDAVDRPTQRWLSPPQGDGIELSEQAQLLQQLRDMMSDDSGTKGSSPLPKLSEQQLREMEKAFEGMRELIGEDKLPNLENIPKEWVDQALSDPLLRKQAQQLLEQYARDRKLPSPSKRNPLNSDGVPFPRSPANNPSNQNPKSSPKQDSRPPASSNSRSPNESYLRRAPDAPTSNEKFPQPSAPKDQTSGALEGQSPAIPRSQNRSGENEGQQLPQSESGGQSIQPSVPTRPDAERIEALKELFKKLKSIEGQQGKNSVENNSPNSSPANSNSSNNRTTRPNSPNPNTTNGQPNTGSPRSTRNNPKSAQPNRTQPMPDGIPNQSTSTPTSDGPKGEVGNDPFDPSLFSQPPESTSSGNADSNDPSQAKSNPLVKPKVPSVEPRKSLNGTRPSDANVNRTAPNSSGRTPNADLRVPDASNSTSVGADVDIKTQLERHGLGRALQSIVEKTMKEQGASNTPNGNTASKSSPTQTKTKDSQAASQNKLGTQAGPLANRAATSRPTPKPSEDIASRNRMGAAQGAQSSNASNPNTSSTMSGIRDMATQFWGAVRTAPEPGSSRSSANPSSMSGSGLGGFAFDWSSTVWLLLALALVGVAMVLLLVRKRVVEATAAKEAEAELAKEILTEGIRTRADVVRAFHRFVMRRAQPVANWWNHRYVTIKLTEASPQLRSVLSDLASVYEHARYLPPEVMLTSEEIDRVQTALKQCATSGA